MPIMIKQNSKTKISFHTLGCRLNQSETAVVRRTFDAANYQAVQFNEPADIAVINTCTVTENGDADTRRLVNKAKRINPNVRIALIGCQAQVQKERLTALPNVRWVVGNGRKMDIKKIVEAVESPDPQVITPTIDRNSFTVPMAGIDPTHTRANLKIQDGCDFFCSFCEIPYARGRARSREFNDILKEANELVEAGYQEIVLTGINIGTYGYQNYQFLDVIDALEQIDGLKRIRISSIEPTTIGKSIFKRMTTKSKLCRYLHIPLQCGDDEILLKMKRKYTTEEFKNFINEAKATVDGICIGTDMIVGFPAEEERHFENSLNAVREWPIDYAHVFSYSRRYMAKSQHFTDSNEASIIAERSRKLREMSQRKRDSFYQKFVGQLANVLFEQKKNGFWLGLAEQYIKVKLKSPKNLSNQFKQVHLSALEKDSAILAT